MLSILLLLACSTQKSEGIRAKPPGDTTVGTRKKTTANKKVVDGVPSDVNTAPGNVERNNEFHSSKGEHFIFTREANGSYLITSKSNGEVITSDGFVESLISGLGLQDAKKELDAFRSFVIKNLPNEVDRPKMRESIKNIYNDYRREKLLWRRSIIYSNFYDPKSGRAVELGYVDYVPSTGEVLEKTVTLNTVPLSREERAKVYDEFEEKIPKELNAQLGLAGLYNENMTTSLHLAVSKEDIDGVKRILDRGVDPNVVNSWKNTPLHEAAHRLEETRNEKVVKEIIHLLLARGADVYFRNMAQDMPIESLMRYGMRVDEEILNALFWSEKGANEDYQEL